MLCLDVPWTCFSEAVDVAKLMEQAGATDSDPQALPEELARRETLKAKLGEACARLEADAPSFAGTVLSMENTIGIPKTVLADIGYASGQAGPGPAGKGVDPLVASDGPARQAL